MTTDRLDRSGSIFHFFRTSGRGSGCRDTGMGHESSLQTPCFLLQTVQNTSSRLIDGPPRYPHLLGHFAGVAFLDCRFPKHSPTARIKFFSQQLKGSPPDGSFIGRQFARRVGRLDSLQREAFGGGDLIHTNLGVRAADAFRLGDTRLISQFIAGDRPQPTAKRRAGPVVIKSGERFGDGGERILHDVGRISRLTPRAPRPRIDDRSIDLSEFPPTIDITLPSSFEQ